MVPPRRRTDPGGRTPPTSPTTSTSHDHRLRHTGPNISTRASATKPALPDHSPETHPKKDKDKKLLADVPSPGSHTPFTKFLYTLLLMVLLLLGWYIYGMIVLLAKLKEDVGWWGIISGDPRGAPRWASWTAWQSRFGSARDGTRSGDVEASLNALADALGIPPLQVASAVKPLVPPASLTNMASMSEKTGVVKVLFEDTRRDGQDDTTRIVTESGGDENVD